MNNALFLIAALFLLKKPTANTGQPALGQNPKPQQQPRPGSTAGKASGGGAGGGASSPGRAAGGKSLLEDIICSSSLFGDSNFGSLLSDPCCAGNIPPTDSCGVIGGFGNFGGAPPSCCDGASLLNEAGSGSLFPVSCAIPQGPISCEPEIDPSGITSCCGGACAAGCTCFVCTGCF